MAIRVVIKIHYLLVKCAGGRFYCAAVASHLASVKYLIPLHNADLSSVVKYRVVLYPRKRGLWYFNCYHRLLCLVVNVTLTKQSAPGR